MLDPQVLLEFILHSGTLLSYCLSKLYATPTIHQSEILNFINVMDQHDLLKNSQSP